MWRPQVSARLDPIAKAESARSADSIVSTQVSETLEAVMMLRPCSRGARMRIPAPPPENAALRIPLSLAVIGGLVLLALPMLAGFGRRRDQAIACPGSAGNDRHEVRRVLGLCCLFKSCRPDSLAMLWSEA